MAFFMSVRRRQRPPATGGSVGPPPPAHGDRWWGDHTLAITVTIPSLLPSPPTTPASDRRTSCQHDALAVSGLAWRSPGSLERDRAVGGRLLANCAATCPRHRMVTLA